MGSRVLEVNVDDLHFGGVFSLVKEVISNTNKSINENIQIDIAAIEKFENTRNIHMLESMGTHVYYVGCKKNKLIKQFICIRNLKDLIKKNNYDFVHIHGDVSNKLFVLGLASKMAGCPNIILHSHAAGVDGNHRKLKFIIHEIFRPLLKEIGTKFVSCSDLASEWMYPNIDKSKVICIHNGVNLNANFACELH